MNNLLSLLQQVDVANVYEIGAGISVGGILLYGIIKVSPYIWKGIKGLWSWVRKLFGKKSTQQIEKVIRSRDVEQTIVKDNSTYNKTTLNAPVHHHHYYPPYIPLPPPKLPPSFPHWLDSPLQHTKIRNNKRDASK